MQRYEEKSKLPSVVLIEDVCLHDQSQRANRSFCLTAPVPEVLSMISKHIAATFQNNVIPILKYQKLLCLLRRWAVTAFTMENERPMHDFSFRFQKSFADCLNLQDVSGLMRCINFWTAVSIDRHLFTIGMLTSRDMCTWGCPPWRRHFSRVADVRCPCGTRI